MSPTSTPFENSLSSSLAPIASVRHGQSGGGADNSGNKHSFISRQYGLADGNTCTRQVLHFVASSAVIAHRLIREWDLNLSIIIAIKSTILPKLITSPTNIIEGIEELTIDAGYE